MWKPSDLQVKCLKEFYEFHCSNPIRDGSRAQAKWGQKYTAQKDYLLNALSIPAQVVHDVDWQGTSYCNNKEVGKMTNQLKKFYDWNYWWPIYFDAHKNEYAENGMSPEEYQRFITSEPPEENPEKYIPDEVLKEVSHQEETVTNNFSYQLNDRGEKIPMFPVLTEIGTKNYENYFPPSDIDAGLGLVVDLNRVKAYLGQLKPGDMFRFGSVLDGNKSYAKYVGTDKTNNQRCYLCQNRDYYGTFYEHQVFEDFYKPDIQAFVIRECNIVDYDKDKYYHDLMGFDSDRLKKSTTNISYVTPSIVITDDVFKNHEVREG